MEERDLHDVLEHGIGAEPPIVGGPEAVFAGARTRIVRTRMMTGALSVAAVLGVAAGAVALGNGGTHGGSGIGQAPGSGSNGVAPTTMPSNWGSQNGQAAPTGAGTGANAGAKGGPLAAAPQPGPGQVLLDGPTATELLKQMVTPLGLTTSHYAGQSTTFPLRGGVEVYGSMAISSAGGLGHIEVNVQQNEGSLYSASCTGDCTVLPDGSHLTIRTVVGDKPTAAGQPQTVDWSADRVFADGHRIVVGVSNYFDGANDHPKGWTLTTTGHDPAVSMAQLKTIVEDPRWQLVVSKDLAGQARTDLPGYNDTGNDPTAVASSPMRKP